MGSEVIFLLAPLGPFIMLYLVFRCFNKNYRPYSLTVLIVSLAVAILSTKRPVAYYWDFFLFFTVSSFLFGSIGHLIKWGIETPNIIPVNKRAFYIRIVIILILGFISVYWVNKKLNS